MCGTGLCSLSCFISSQLHLFLCILSCPIPPPSCTFSCAISYCCPEIRTRNYLIWAGWGTWGHWYRCVFYQFCSPKWPIQSHFSVAFNRADAFFTVFVFGLRALCKGWAPRQCLFSMFKPSRVEWSTTVAYVDLNKTRKFWCPNWWAVWRDYF